MRKRRRDQLAGAVPGAAAGVAQEQDTGDQDEGHAARKGRTIAVSYTHRSVKIYAGLTCFGFSTIALKPCVFWGKIYWSLFEIDLVRYKKETETLLVSLETLLFHYSKLFFDLLGYWVLYFIYS